jgi:hypothetical protein
VPATAAPPCAEEVERRRQLLQALTTEHFTLQTARSATIADSNGRSALYLATVSSAVVALALLPALVLLGVLTYLRLVQTAIEDLIFTDLPIVEYLTFMEVMAGSDITSSSNAAGASASLLSGTAALSALFNLRPVVRSTTPTRSSQPRGPPV